MIGKAAQNANRRAGKAEWERKVLRAGKQEPGKELGGFPCPAFGLSIAG